MFASGIIISVLLYPEVCISDEWYNCDRSYVQWINMGMDLEDKMKKSLGSNSQSQVT